MMNQWHPREYRDGDEKEILNLFRKGFGEERTIEHWMWQYKKNPAGKGVIFLADCGGKIVGHYAVVPTRFKIGDNEVLGSQSLDTVTDEAFLRKGIFTTLAQLTYDMARSRGARLVYGYPNRLSYYGLIKKLGFQEVVTVSRLAKTLTLKGLILRVTKRPRILKRSSFLTRMFPNRKVSTKPSKANGIHVVEHSGPFDSEYDELWRRVGRYFPVALIRDANYLNWRYLERPESKYEIFEATKKDKILGFILGRAINHDSWKEGYIVDFLTTSASIFGALLEEILWKFREEGVDIVYTWSLRSSKFRGNLLDKGFREGTTDIVLTTKILADKLPVSTSNPRNWLVTRGDCDGI